MNGLEQSDISYVIISSNRLDDIYSILYSKEYKIIPIKEYFDGEFKESIIFYGNGNNDDLRRDTLFLLNSYNEETAIIKYFGESHTNRILREGSERPLDLIKYNTDYNNISYIHEGISFSFKDSKRYWKPSKKEDFKVGMIVEYLNNNKWCESVVNNPETDWEKLYKLLVKYDKLRVVA